MARLSEIYYNIDESNFCFEYDDMKFYFSSLFYLNKFKEEYKNFIKSETEKLVLRFKSSIEADYLILILLYKKIEKRGFRVYYKDRKLDRYNISLEIK